MLLGKRGARVGDSTSACRGGGIQLGEAEIQNLGVAALGHKNICGLDIAMDDAFGVRRVQSISHFDGDLQNALQLHGAAGDGVFESHAIEEFHGDERFAVLDSDVVDGADIRVIQRGRGLRFALETRQSLGIFGNFVREKFQSNEAVEPRVFRFVDNSHATAAEFFHNAVVGYVLTHQRLGFRHLAHIISGVAARGANGCWNRSILVRYSFTRYSARSMIFRVSRCDVRAVMALYRE